MKDLIKQFNISLRFLIMLTLMTGVFYPLFVTFFAQLFFPWQANGSLLKSEGKNTGSLLIGQYFTDEKYFWGRPSATSRLPYDAENSSGSNMAVSNPQFMEAVKARVDHWHRADPQQTKRIPADLVTASGSGLDPEISLAAALYQVPRIARVRNLSENDLNNAVRHLVQGRSLGLLGEPRVNVLELNLVVDRLKKS